MDHAASDSEAQRIAALLQLVVRDRDERIRSAHARAEALGHDIVRQARHDATRRVREAARRARDDARRRLEAARAELSTRDRERDRELALSLLDRAWRALSTQLERRWQDPSARARWTASLVGLAQRVLPRTTWIIEHPVEFRGAELESLLRTAEKKTGSAPDARADRTLTAGLRFIANGNKLDGSIAGLLARSDGVKSRLVAELFRDSVKEAR